MKQTQKRQQKRQEPTRRHQAATSTPAVEMEARHPLRALQDTVGNHSVVRRVQPKLRLSRPGDRQEREADRIADQLLRQEVEEKRDSTRAPVPLTASRQVAPGVLDVDETLENRLMRSQGSGRSLPNELRAFVEPRMQFDFGRVRIHTDDKADRISQELGARAFTHGLDIYFRTSCYNPESQVGRRLLIHELTHVIQQSRDVQGASGRVARKAVEEGPTLGEFSAEIAHEVIIANPKLLASIADQYLKELEEISSQMEPSDPYLRDRVDPLIWEFADLYCELQAMLKDMEEGQQTTEEQRKKAEALFQKCRNLEEDIVAREDETAAHNKLKMHEDLKRAIEAVKQLQIQLAYTYHDIYETGQEPEDVEVGSGTMKSLAEKTKDTLEAINEADANFTGREVAPLVPVLENTLSVVNLIIEWRFTPGLAGETQEALDTLRNAWKLIETVTSVTGLKKFLPLFSHIGPLLDGILNNYAKVAVAMRGLGYLSLQAGDEPETFEFFPGRKPVLKYMKKVCRASKVPFGHPGDDVVKFFNRNREMFSAATEVLDLIGEFPTKPWLGFWEKVDPDKLNAWVYYNRDMVWRLIYGRGMPPPEYCSPPGWG